MYLPLPLTVVVLYLAVPVTVILFTVLPTLIVNFVLSPLGTNTPSLVVIKLNSALLFCFLVTVIVYVFLSLFSGVTITLIVFVPTLKFWTPNPLIFAVGLLASPLTVRLDISFSTIKLYDSTSGSNEGVKLNVVSPFVKVKLFKLLSPLAGLTTFICISFVVLSSDFILIVFTLFPTLNELFVITWYDDNSLSNSNSNVTSLA